MRQGVASSEAEMSHPLERGSLPSSEAEVVCPLEGRFATLERGGDGLPARGRFATFERGGDAGRGQGPRWDPSSEAEIISWAREGCEWAAC